MEDRKKIEKYIGSHPILLILGMLLVIAGLVCIILGMLAGRNAGSDVIAEEFFPIDAESGSTCYVDVVGISDWIYRTGSGAYYYTLLDTEGYFYTARVSDRTLRAMKDQRVYWNDDTAPMPQPYRLEGIARKTPSGVAQGFCQAWEITEDEFHDYFGDYLLDATSNASNDASAAYYAFAYLTILFGVIFLISALPGYRRTNKTLQALEQAGLIEQVAAQMESDSSYVIGNNRGLLTRDFLIGRGTGTVIPVQDILWAYQRNLRYFLYLINVNTYLIVSTAQKANQVAINLARPDHGELSDLIAQLAHRNPDIILGASSEARRAYREARKDK